MHTVPDGPCGNLYPLRIIAWSIGNGVHESEFSVGLCHLNMDVDQTLNFAFKSNQLVIMRREQGSGLYPFADVLGD